MERRKTDPLKNLKPGGPVQARALESLSPQLAITGANRSGKSFLMAAKLADRVRNTGLWCPAYGNKRKFLLVAPSRKQIAQVWAMYLLNDSRMPGFRESGFIPQREIEKIQWDTAPSGRVPTRILLKNGNELIVGYSAAARFKDMIQGIPFDAIFIDERSVSQATLYELALRLADARSEWPHGGQIVWGASEVDEEPNPAHEDFLVKCREGMEGFEEVRLRNDENPTISAEARNSLRGLVSEDIARVRIDGIGSASDQHRIYGKWLDNPEIAARMIVDEEYVPGPDDNVVIGYDPGWDHPTGILFASIRPEDPMCLHFWAGHLGRKMTHDQHAAIVREHLRGRKVRLVSIDPSAFTDKSGIGKPVIDIIVDAWRSQGIRFATDANSWIRPLNRHAPGIATVRDMMEQDRIKFYMRGPGMGEVLRQLRSYRGKPERQYQGEGGVVKKHDEFCDCLRYIAVLQLTYEHLGNNPLDGAPQPEPKPTGPVDPQMEMSARIAEEFARQRRSKRRLR